MNESKSVLSIVIPQGFQKDIYRGGASVQVLVDGTQSTAAYLSSAYINGIIEQYSSDILKRREDPQVIKRMPRVELRSRIYFNPEARDDIFEGINEFFMIVALIGMILPAAILIREKEYGTVEQILISPLSLRRFIFMKIAASNLFLLFMIGFCYEVVLKLWLGFPLKGTLSEFLLLSMIFGIATSGLSFIIASIARRFSQIGMLTIAFFAPMLLLSGGWVPPEALPLWLRRVSFLSPLKYYMDTGIGFMIRGADIGLLLPGILRLSVLGVVLIVTGYVMYNRRILREQ
jgi:ABC-2 type transport system permease protein